MIDVSRIEKGRRCDDGWVGRCPACAEARLDKTGNHLRVWQDGSYACVVNPGKDGTQHRRRIWSLLGGKIDRSNLPSVPRLFSGLPPAGTLVTPISSPRASQGKTGYTHIHTYGSLEHPSQASQPTSNGEDLKLPVPSVPNQSLALKGPRPFIDSSGGLVIPSNSPARYHYWKGGQSVDETLNEIQSAGAFSTFTAAQVAVPNQPP
jgi:hypothetical protein